MTLEKVVAGQKFTPRADTWNAFVDSAEDYRRRTHNGGAGQAADPNRALIDYKNESGLDVPDRGVIWLADMTNNSVQASAQRPVYPCVTRYGVSDGPVAIGAPGRAWIDGIRQVLVSDWSTLVAGDRIGPQKDSFAACKQAGGSMVVMGKLDSPYVRALITRKRFDSKVVVGPDGVAHVAEVIVLGMGRLATPVDLTPTVNTIT